MLLLTILRKFRSVTTQKQVKFPHSHKRKSCHQDNAFIDCNSVRNPCRIYAVFATKLRDEQSGAKLRAKRGLAFCSLESLLELLGFASWTEFSNTRRHHHHGFKHGRCNYNFEGNVDPYYERLFYEEDATHFHLRDTIIIHTAIFCNPFFDMLSLLFHR